MDTRNNQIVNTQSDGLKHGEVMLNIDLFQYLTHNLSAREVGLLTKYIGRAATSKRPSYIQKIIIKALSAQGVE